MDWTVDVKRFYVKTNKVNKKGKPVVIPVTHRKLFLNDPKSIGDSGIHRIFRRERKDKETQTVNVTYCLATKPRIEQSLWENPNGRGEAWYKIGEEYQRNGKAMTEVQFLQWLKVRVGTADAVLMLHTLLTQEPGNLAKAA